MTAAEYINSGLLEGYVLGALGAEDTAEVIAAIGKYPEVAAEVADIETALFRLAGNDAITPPAALEERIWSALQESQQEPANINGEKKTATVIPLTGHGAISYRLRWERAAVWAALIGSLLFNVMLWRGRQADTNHIVTLQQHLGASQQAQQALAATIGRYTQENDMLARPDMQPIILQSTQKTQPMAATIYWDKQHGSAYIAIQKLPPPPPGRQYQLWVIAGGKPVSLGVLPDAMIDARGMQQVATAVPDGQAFAISLEKEGGSPQPTMSQIFVMGKVAS